MSVHQLHAVTKDGETEETKARRATLKALLQDVLDRVDEVDIETFCMIGIMSDGSILSARHVEENYYTMIGALEKQKNDVMTLLNQKGDTASETEY